MSEMSKRAREAAESKVKRLVRPNSGSIDASGWREPTDEKGGIQTGPRPISRRQFKSGGKVHGEKPSMHAGRKPRASGGLTANSLINRNVKTANDERPGEKHIGGMKRGGRAHKDMGGTLALPAWANAVSRASGGRTGKLMGGPMMGRPNIQAPAAVGGGAPSGALNSYGLFNHNTPTPAARGVAPGGAPGVHQMMRKSGGKVHADAAQDKKMLHAMGCKCAKCSGGRVGRAAGGTVNDGTRPVGDRIARAKGGRTKKAGMNVNIIIAQPGAKSAAPMPPPGGAPVGMGAPPPPPMAAPGGAPPMGPPPMMARKNGGRTNYPIDAGAGGGKGRLEKIRAYGG